MKYLGLILLLLPLLISCDLIESAEGNSYLHGFIQGNIDNWELGAGKRIKFGRFNENPNDVVIFGTTEIESDGSFYFDTLSTPPRSIMEDIEEGPDGDGDCVSEMVISDDSAKVAFGSFVITDPGTNEILGKVFRTNRIDFQDHPMENDYHVEYVFANRYVTIDGRNICTKNNYGNTYTEIVSASLFLNSGWNIVVDNITYVADDTLKRFVDNFEPAESRWFFVSRDDAAVRLYPFAQSGQINNWTLGDNHKLIFGGYDYRTDRFATYAETGIADAGNFHFDSSSSPPSHVMRFVQELLEDHPSCNNELTASNSNVMVGEGSFIVIDNRTDDSIGDVIRAYRFINETGEEITQSKARFIFAQEHVNVTGKTTCNWTFDNGNVTDVKEWNITLEEGWNVFYDTFERFENDTAYFNVSNTPPADVGWYYQEFTDGQ